jgi:hypothetical protein
LAWTRGYFLSQAKKAGIRIIGVDPRKSPSIEQWADEWIPIRPGTDAAMLIAMAYVVIAENLHDRSFIERYTLGFDRFADYVLGKEDGVAKTRVGRKGSPECRRIGSSDWPESMPGRSQRPSMPVGPPAGRPSASSITGPPRLWPP